MPKTLDIDILSTGTNIDAFGNEIETDLKKLKEIANSYDPSLFKGKIILGHSSDPAFMAGRVPSDKIPSHGTIERAYVDEDEGKLRGVVEVADDAVDWISEKHFTDRSVALYSPTSPYSPKKGEYYIRHLALLGAAPPAIKGLKPLDEILAESYSESTDLGVETITMKDMKNTVPDNTGKNLDEIEANMEKDPTVLSEDNRCWEGYEPVPGMKPGEKGSCRKIAEANEEPIEEIPSEGEEVEANQEEDLGNETEESTPDASEFLNENSGTLISAILQDGENGYQGEITRFVPEPNEENNWLTDEEGNFAGIFVDESLGEPEEFEFTITRQGEDWVSSFKPVVDPVVEEEDEANMEVPVEANGQKKIALEEPMEEEEVEEEMEANSQLNSDTRVSETVLNTEKKPLVEANGHDCGCKKVDPRDKEIAMLRKALMEKEEYELYRQSSELYSEGILLEGQVPESDLKKILSTLNGMQTTVAAFGEEYETPASMLLGLLKKLPKQVVFSEEISTQLEKTEQKLPVKPPTGVAFSEEGVGKMREIMAYCEQHGLNVKDRNDFKKAMKATAK